MVNLLVIKNEETIKKSCGKKTLLYFINGLQRIRHFEMGAFTNKSCNVIRIIYIFRPCSYSICNEYKLSKKVE